VVCLSLIAVDVVGLGILGQELARAGDDLRRVGAGLAAVAGAGLDPRVERSLTDVVSGWRRGIDRVGEGTATAGCQVLEAARAYEETERALAGGSEAGG
jgi:hypothetical protein